jgi:predicted enzyme related to lactoylglutathione lyase
MKRLFVLAALAVALMCPQSAWAQTAPAGAAILPRIVMVKVYVTDFARSERFYRDVFGLGAPHAYNASERAFTFPSQTGVPDPNAPLLVLVQTPTARPNGMFALLVPDLDAVMARVPAAGGAITRPAADLPSAHVRLGFITDPDGASIEVIQAMAPH